MGSTGSSIPHSLILDALTCQKTRSVIRGNRSQDASSTFGSWQNMWAQHCWIPHLSHTLWKHCSTSITPIDHNATCDGHLRYWVTELKKTAIPFLSPLEMSLRHHKHWHFHFLPDYWSMSILLIFSWVFSFSWVGAETQLPAEGFLSLALLASSPYFSQDHVEMVSFANHSC